MLRHLSKLLLVSVISLSTVAQAGTFKANRTSNGELIAFLEHPDPRFRMDAIEAVLDRRMVDAEGVLARLAHGDDDPRVRNGALRGMQKLNCKDALPAAEATVLEDRDKDNRIDAIAIIEDLGNDRSAPVLAQVLEGDPEAGTRKKAVRVLGKRRWTGAEEVILQAAKADPDGGVRREAMAVCSRTMGERGRAVVRDLLLTDPDAGVRREAVDLLRDQPVAGDKDALIRALDDRDEDVAVFAARGLIRLGDRSAGPILREKSRRAPTRKLQKEMAEAAHELGD